MLLTKNEIILKFMFKKINLDFSFNLKDSFGSAPQGIFKNLTRGFIRIPCTNAVKRITETVTQVRASFVSEFEKGADIISPNAIPPRSPPNPHTI